MLLGVDTGGTFTDFVLVTAEGLTIHKVLSTPHAPEQAILQGISELGLDSQTADLVVVHGSTVATNAVLEGKGVKTVYITNRGLGDVLTLGRQARQALYDLQPPLTAPPVEQALCLETGGRMDANGNVIEPLTETDLEQLASELARLEPRAVAINMLFSFLDESIEQAIEAVIPEGIFVSRSSAILPEYREYERGITTWLNASVGPLVKGYLDRLQSGVSPAPVSVMQSSGSTIAAQQAGDQAVHLLLSGPAGGLAGARFMGETSACSRLLTFDMGGTSTDVALIDGDIALTSQGQIAGYPVAVPMVDMHTIGAGGGSLASVDAGGLLQVGPESAGASPGPACYGQGGTCATVTDANLVLGRLRADAFLGGDMRLDEAAAQQAVGEVAAQLSVTVQEAAEGILRVANEHMARALRVISLQRGIDPREFTLTSFGGAGGLHVCALAEALGIEHALVPVHGGVLSAFGMLVAPRGRELSRSVNTRMDDFSDAQIESVISELASRGYGELAEEGIAKSDIHLEPVLDLCYQGQSYSLSIPWQGRQQSMASFHDAHVARYGHDLELPVELVTIRLHLHSSSFVPRLSSPVKPAAMTTEHIVVHGIDEPVQVCARDSMAVGDVLSGPALITETVSTTWLAPGWQARKHESGSLLLQRF